MEARNQIIPLATKIYKYGKYKIDEFNSNERDVIETLKSNLQEDGDTTDFNANTVKGYFLVDLCDDEINELNSKLKDEPDFQPRCVVLYNAVSFIEKVNNKKTNEVWVENEIIELDCEDNVLKYNHNFNGGSDEFAIIKEAIIVNVKGKSINNIWKKYGPRALGLNLRFYVKNSKIDKSIKDTIETHSNEFWFKNNGLLILCKDYDFNGKELTLTDFSIVNGGQTTKILGDFEPEGISDNIYVTTKIIKLNSNEDNTKITHLANEIAEASNRQKPIKAEDLIVNNEYLITLKDSMKDHPNGIFIISKRNELKFYEELEQKFSDKYKKINAKSLLQSWICYCKFTPSVSVSDGNKWIEKYSNECFEYLKDRLDLTYDLALCWHIILNDSKKKPVQKKLRALIEAKETIVESVVIDNELEKVKDCVKYMAPTNLLLLKIILLYKNTELEGRNETVWTDCRKLIEKKDLEAINKYIDEKLTTLNIKRIFKPDITPNKLQEAYNEFLIHVADKMLRESLEERNEDCEKEKIEARSLFGSDNNISQFVLGKILGKIQKLNEKCAKLLDLLATPDESQSNE